MIDEHQGASDAHHRMNWIGLDCIGWGQLVEFGDEESVRCSKKDCVSDTYLFEVGRY